MTLEVFSGCDADCFDLPEWRALVASDPDRHVFATPEWNRLWWEEFSSGKDLSLLTLARGESVVGIVPLYREVEGPLRVLRFLGGVALTDYLGPICRPADHDEVADALLEWLVRNSSEWDLFDGHCLPPSRGFADVLVERARVRDLVIERRREDVSGVLSLPSSWEDYLQGLTAKQRHELRRKRRRLGRELPGATVRRSTQDTLEADLKIFVDLHRGAEGHKGHFMKPEIATFFDRLANGFIEKGWLRLDLLEAEGRAFAATFGFVFDDTFYLYNSAYEPEAARLSPGLVLVSDLIEGAIEDGLTTFDFLRGAERYKSDLGAKWVPLDHVRMASPPVLS